MNTTLKTALAKETLLKCSGYDARFITPDVVVDIDKILNRTHKKKLPLVEGNKKKQLHYSNLTVLYNAERRVPFLSAYNIDGTQKKEGIKRAASFSIDPRIDPAIQLSQKGFYDLRKDITEFEIGHMAANNEMAWGEQAQVQSYQTFHYPNSAPQAERLNSGIWKSLESYIINEAGTSKASKRISVFTGPILSTKDPLYVKDKNFRIPLLFYKVIVFRTRKGVFATAFVMSHEQKMREDKMFIDVVAKGMKAEGQFDDFPYRKVFQVNIPMLEKLSGLRFRWDGVQPVVVPEDKNQILNIRNTRDAADAAKEKSSLRKGMVPKNASAKASISDKEIREKHFRLNMILP